MVVLLAALMHAIWNSLISQASEKGLFTLALHICSAVLAVPVLLVVGLPSELSYPYVLVSIFLHGLYIYILTKVYAKSAFGPAYIVMRGMAPVFVMIISLLWLNESFDTASFLGLLFLTLGVLFLMNAYQVNIISWLCNDSVGHDDLTHRIGIRLKRDVCGFRNVDLDFFLQRRQIEFGRAFSHLGLGRDLFFEKLNP